MRLRRSGVVAVCVVAVGVPAYLGFAHCQIPCGIYDDDILFALMRQHVATIEKSMNQIQELSKDPGANANQLVRWTNNKDDHADLLAGIVTEYFLQQRIKPVETRSGEEWDAYVEKLRLCHETLVTSMKAKQTVDLQHVEKLKSLVDAFQAAYLGHEHEAGH